MPSDLARIGARGPPRTLVGHTAESIHHRHRIPGQAGETPAMSTQRGRLTTSSLIDDRPGVDYRLCAEKAARDLGEDPLAAIRAFRDAALDAPGERR